VTRNVTLSLPEEVALWVRLKAAKSDTSVSSYLSQLLQEQMHEENTFDTAFQKWCLSSPMEGVDAANRMSRDEVHER